MLRRFIHVAVMMFAYWEIFHEFFVACWIFFEKFLQEYHQSVIQFGSRSGLRNVGPALVETVCNLGYQQSTLIGKEASSHTCCSCDGGLKGINPLLHWLFLDHDIIFYFKTTLKKIQEKFKLSFEYFWKCYGKWSICSKRANAPISIIFSNAWYFKLTWSKGLISP